MPDWFRNYGNLGVEIFFVLSGYLIYGSLIGRRTAFTRFIFRRIQRIYPAFIVAFALEFAAKLAGGGHDVLPAGAVDAALVIAANLLLLPGILPLPQIMAVAWTLSYEMFFYFATGAAVLGGHSYAASRRTRIAVIVALAVVFIAVSTLEIPNFPTRMMPFFAGMLLAEGLGERVPAWAGWAMLLVDFVITINHALPMRYFEILHSGAFFCLCAVCFRNAGIISRLMRWTPLRWLGNMSYSFYLIHGLVVLVSMAVLGKLLPGMMPEALFWLAMPVLFTAALGASAALFIAVEKPLSLNTRRKSVIKPAATGATG